MNKFELTVNGLTFWWYCYNCRTQPGSKSSHMHELYSLQTLPHTQAHRQWLYGRPCKNTGQSKVKIKQASKLSTSHCLKTGLQCPAILGHIPDIWNEELALERHTGHLPWSTLYDPLWRLVAFEDVLLLLTFLVSKQYNRFSSDRLVHMLYCSYKPFQMPCSALFTPYE